jgi:hypothetical protein
VSIERKIHVMTALPSAKEILDAIEGKGYALTLELRGTAHKWVSGKNLFMGITDSNGMRVRDAYGPVAVEMSLRVGSNLNWTAESGAQVSDHTQALRNTVQRGSVRRSSTIYNAMRILAQLAR